MNNVSSLINDDHLGACLTTNESINANQIDHRKKGRAYKAYTRATKVAQTLAEATTHPSPSLSTLFLHHDGPNTKP